MITKGLWVQVSNERSKHTSSDCILFILQYSFLVEVQTNDHSTNLLTFSNPISLNKTFSCKLILSLKISRRKVFIIKEDNSCVKLCWEMCWSQDVLSPVGYSQTKDVFIMYSIYWEILTKKLCHKFSYANEF